MYMYGVPVQPGPFINGRGDDPGIKNAMSGYLMSSMYLWDGNKKVMMLFDTF
jgi:hypothetical protein